MPKDWKGPAAAAAALGFWLLVAGCTCPTGRPTAGLAGGPRCWRIDRTAPCAQLCARRPVCQPSTVTKANQFCCRHPSFCPTRASRLGFEPVSALIWVPSRPCNKRQVSASTAVTSRISGCISMNNPRRAQFYRPTSAFFTFISLSVAVLFYYIIIYTNFRICHIYTINIIVMRSALHIVYGTRTISDNFTTATRCGGKSS